MILKTKTSTKVLLFFSQKSLRNKLKLACLTEANCCCSVPQCETSKFRNDKANFHTYPKHNIQYIGGRTQNNGANAANTCIIIIAVVFVIMAV